MFRRLVFADESNESIFPATVFNDCAVSKTFLIIFKNEEVELDDQFNFKLSVIVDAQNVSISVLKRFFTLAFVADRRIFSTNGFAARRRIVLFGKRFFVRRRQKNFPIRTKFFLFSPEKIAQMQQLCSRCFKLHFNPRSGLHTHLPILFDYFHLSALTTTIHGSLLCLIPPYVFDRSV